MAVPEQTPYIEHTGNGVTTSFALKFQCESKDHLIVLIDDIEPPIATWSLIGGDVVFTTAPAAGKKITLQRNTPFSRTTDYQSYNNSFRPPAVNKDFDWIWLKLQELGVADWILGARIDALKNYVDRKDDELKAYLMEEIRKQGVALDQLDEYYNYLMERLAQIAVDKGWDSSFIVHKGKTQYEINEDQSNINNKKVTFLSSVQKLINFKNPEDGQLFNVIGYSEGWAVESVFLGPLGGGDFVFSATLETNPDGGSIISPTSGAGRFIRLKTSVVCPEDFGVDHKGLSESTAAMAACLNYAIKNKSKIIAQNSYLIDSINVSSVAGILDLNLTGTIKRRNAASVGDLIALGNKDGIEIYGGGTFDFNHQNQALWSDGVTADSAKNFDVRGLNFINAKKTAIYTKSRNFDYISIKSNIFKEGALHSGVAGEFCTFVITRGGKSVNVKCNKFIQNTSSGANQNRTPCGYLNIDTGATSANGSFSIKYNYFENLGMHCASNLLSPLDFYSYADQIEIKHNKFRLCNLTPIRTSSGKNIDVSCNDIIQTKAQIIDGGAAYAEAAMIAAGLVDRGYTTDKNDVANASISGNTLISIGVTCRAVSCSSNGVDNIFRLLDVENNTMRSSGENTSFGVFANGVQQVNVRGGQIEGFGAAVRFQGTSNNAAIAAEGNSLLTVRDVKIKNCLTGIYARDAITNADIIIDGAQISGSASLSFTVRNAASLVVKNTNLGGQRGDVSALPVFIFKDNIPGTSSLPVGHDTCTYFRLKDNIGQIDAVSV